MGKSQGLKKATSVEIAHLLLFPGEKFPKGLSQIAKRVIENFNIRVLGEELAKQVVFQVTNEICFPDKTEEERIIARTLSFASELFDELPDEPHVSQIQWLAFRKSL